MAGSQVNLVHGYSYLGAPHRSWLLQRTRGALALAFSTGVTNSEAFGFLTSDWTLSLQGMWSKDLDTYQGSAEAARCPIARSDREPQIDTAHPLYGASSKRWTTRPHNAPPIASEMIQAKSLRLFGNCTLLGWPGPRQGLASIHFRPSERLEKTSWRLRHTWARAVEAHLRREHWVAQWMHTTWRLSQNRAGWLNLVETAKLQKRACYR